MAFRKPDCLYVGLKKFVELPHALKSASKFAAGRKKIAVAERKATATLLLHILTK